ncbi:hypothetical protein HXX76_014798 [Chlamydomonas incerta]|uniref:Uncharacterized protein n=1 Tax=Chlamydomonas incerta TaxID=51695 RepID=A0A835VSQ9_CHLIN|nr:hypothetical protein HXX76_014798 [Chlamydomonas incerta]|eukprot:KAG2424124.1 hypothetical protein HXX76_014798 [Chlamydomonas incerta]
MRRWGRFVVACVVLAVHLVHRSSAAPTSQSSGGAKATGLSAASGPHITANDTHIIVYGSGNDTFDPALLPGVEQLYGTIKHIGFHGVHLPDTLPSNWTRFAALRSLVIDCAVAKPAGAGGGAGGSGSAAGLPPPDQRPQLYGSEAQLGALKWFIEFKQGSAVSRLSVLNCGMRGDFSSVWRRYMSGVQIVNLTGNALAGNFTAIDDFEEVCTPDFAGDDYADPDCSSPNLHVLDVSSNALSGPISTGAALGDDVTDAVCSTGCLSLVLARGVTRPEVLCMAPLLVHAADNPGLAVRPGLRYASGYVTGDRSNWCFEPASRWVLPVLWSLFLSLLAGVLAITLYARVRLKRVPFRMHSPSFDVLARASNGAALPPLPTSSSAKAAAAAAASGAYMGLPGGGGGAGSAAAAEMEMMERQAMIPKTGPPSGASPGGGSPAMLPVSSPLPPGGLGGDGAHGDGAVVAMATGVGGRAGYKAGGGGGGGLLGRLKGGGGGAARRDPGGMRAALTADMADSSGARGPGGGGGGGDDVFTLESDEEVEAGRGMGLELAEAGGAGPAGGSPGGGSSGGGLTLGDRAAAAAAGRRATGGGLELGGELGGGVVAVPSGGRTWGGWARAVGAWAADVASMQLRTLLVLGMFGLECYWAYGLILYRGGWQLLVLIPNYVEHTLAGIAMLRAFMAGTHGRWKWVAPVPLLPFSMASAYLIYGFFAYPFGLANIGPVSWDKFIDLMDSCGVLSSTCWAIFSSLAYWQGNSVSTSYQYFNTDIFLGMMLLCFVDLLSTAHHLAATLQVPFKQWLRKELDVRRIRHEPDKSHRLALGDGDL